MKVPKGRIVYFPPKGSSSGGKSVDAEVAFYSALGGLLVATACYFWVAYKKKKAS